MAEIQESSVLFSLKQLMRLEDQRLREEREAAQRRALAEQEARRALERQALAEEEARLRAEEERRRREEAAAREEAARLEAIRAAAVEKARVEAEQRARIEALEKQQEHERSLAALAGDAQRRRLRRLVAAGSALGALVTAATLGLYLGKIRPDAERARAEHAATRAQHERRLAELEGDLAARERQIRDLSLAYQTVRSEAEKAELQRKLNEARRDRDVIQGRITRPPAQPPPKVEPCVCNEGDPMCGCLPR
ncbi:carbohydrate-binding protein [Sorangium cellulosum]|uniref:Carbohydrate-binding protein n=1 Tax=Sorangium cellulosum TaxID=56 RepID=A0A2L0F6L9_SORCE|nr:hypothetical protein [Sorangium cellulosum]AUX47216.1 carbohydrate-binding protein [Sorangium cellulosum]